MLNEFTDPIRSAAGIVARKWPGVIDADDCAQEMWAHLLEREGSVQKLAEMTESERRNSLVRIGHQIASQYRADYEVFTGQVHYTTDDVRAVLELGALTGTRTAVDAARIDLDEGVELLGKRSPQYVQAIRHRHTVGESDDPAERKLYQRSVDALTVEMNNVHRRRARDYDDGPGSRRVVSNARAIAGGA